MNPEVPGIWKAAALAWCDTGHVLRKLPVLTFVALLIALAFELGCRLIKSTIQEQRPDRQRPSNFAPVCRSGLRCA